MLYGMKLRIPVKCYCLKSNAEIYITPMVIILIFQKDLDSSDFVRSCKKNNLVKIHYHMSDYLTGLISEMTFLKF